MLIYTAIYRLPYIITTGSLAITILMEATNTEKYT